MRIIEGMHIEGVEAICSLAFNQVFLLDLVLQLLYLEAHTGHKFESFGISTDPMI